VQIGRSRKLINYKMVGQMSSSNGNEANFYNKKKIDRINGIVI
jgi:hypothetical protein